MRGRLVLMESGASLTKVVDLCVWLTSPSGVQYEDIDTQVPVCSAFCLIKVPGIVLSGEYQLIPGTNQ